MTRIDEPDDEPVAAAFEAARLRHLQVDLALTPAERLVRVEAMVREMDSLHGRPPALEGAVFDSFEAFNGFKAGRMRP